MLDCFEEKDTLLFCDFLARWPAPEMPSAPGRPHWRPSFATIMCAQWGLSKSVSAL